MIRYYFIRHGKTLGNTKKRYIGITDEPILEEAKQKLVNKIYPNVDGVFVSPLLRCKETASIIYPDLKAKEILEIRECDFGDFENKNYMELADDDRYQAWIDSNGKMKFPNGEDHLEFKKRCVIGFEKIERISKENNYTSVAIICHGGSIMSVFQRFATPCKSFYQWCIEHGEYRVLER